jgi:hypothetical protein
VFGRKRKMVAMAQVEIDPLDRAKQAVDALNRALEALPPGTRISPWVERRVGQRPMVVLQSWEPGFSTRVHP